MKGRSLTIVGIFAAIVAAILLFGYNMINSKTVIITVGILFMGVGVLNLILNSSAAKNGNQLLRVFTLVANTASIILGLCMLIFEPTFSPLISFIFSLIVAISALWQFFALAVGSRPHQLPAWLYAFPIILSGCAVYMFIFLPKNNDVALMLATGVSMAVLAVGCIIEGMCLGAARRSFEKAKAEAELQSHPDADISIEHVPDPTGDKGVPPANKETTEDLDDEIKESNYE